MVTKRVYKEHEIRKGELLDIAQDLFTQNGYETTPVNRIIEKAGVSKGTFYHYFKHKEDLLDALADRVTGQIVQRIQKNEEKLTGALDRFNAFFLESSRWRADNRQMIMMLIKALYRDENILLRHKFERQWAEVCTPILAGIIKQGVSEGTFTVSEPEESAALILDIIVAIREAMSGLFLELDNVPGIWFLIDRKIHYLEEVLERILGTRKGTIKIHDDELLAMLKSI